MNTSVKHPLLFSIFILFVLISTVDIIPNVSAVPMNNHLDDVMNNRELDNNYNNSLWSLGNGIQESSS